MQETTLNRLRLVTLGFDWAEYPLDDINRFVYHHYNHFLFIFNPLIPLFFL